MINWRGTEYTIYQGEAELPGGWSVECHYVPGKGYWVRLSSGAVHVAHDGYFDDAQIALDVLAGPLGRLE